MKNSKKTEADLNSSGEQRYALKRIFVNNDKDLAVCKREISIVVSWKFTNFTQILRENIFIYFSVQFEWSS